MKKDQGGAKISFSTWKKRSGWYLTFHHVLWLELVSFHHLSFTTFEFLKDKCYQKVPVSAYISCTEGLISSELYNFRSLFTARNIEQFWNFNVFFVFLVDFWINDHQNHDLEKPSCRSSLFVSSIFIFYKSSLLNRTPLNLLFPHRSLVRLFQRLANWAIISSTLLPVTNYLPWWRTMRYLTWSSRLAWYQMNEYILHCTAIWQRTLRL